MGSIVKGFSCRGPWVMFTQKSSLTFRASGSCEKSRCSRPHGQRKPARCCHRKVELLALRGARYARFSLREYMSYDLNRFSAQSFELVQALAIEQLGPATQIYGAGRDGAREATFEGRCKPAPNGPSWDIIVVQAKYSSTSQNSDRSL